MSVLTASLRAAQTASIVVDEQSGTIKNGSIMTIGPATGHGFNIDMTTLRQVEALINKSPRGITCRFDHVPVGSLGTDVGIVRNARIEGNSLRGDVFLSDWSADMPRLGNARGYLLKKAASDPTGIGLSVVMTYTTDVLKSSSSEAITPVARVESIYSIDFVEQPAANPNGLLSRKSTTSPMPVVITVGVNRFR